MERKHSYRCTYLTYERFPHKFPSVPACDCGATLSHDGLLIAYRKAQQEINDFLRLWRTDGNIVESLKAETRHAQKAWSSALEGAAEALRERDTERMMREERDRLLTVTHEQLDGARAEVERVRQLLASAAAYMANNGLPEQGRYYMGLIDGESIPDLK